MPLGYLLRFHFSFLGYAPYFSFFLFFRCCCISSYSAFPAVCSGLCSLFSFPVRPLGHSLLGFLPFCFFLFGAFGCLWFDCPESFLLPLGAFPVLLEFRTSSSASDSFSYLSLLLSSTGSLFSSSCFCIGCPGVRFCSWGCYFSCGSGCGSAFSFILLFPLLSFPPAAVPAAPCSLSLHYSACCGYDWFFRSYSTFPHAAAKAAPFCLPQHFRLLQLQLLFPVFVPVFRMLRLRLLILFLAQPLLSSLLMVLRLRFLGVWLLPLPAFLLVSIEGLLPNAFVSHRFVSLGCVLSLGVSSPSRLFEMFFDPASVPPQSVCLPLFVWCHLPPL